MIVPVLARLDALAASDTSGRIKKNTPWLAVPEACRGN